MQSYLQTKTISVKPFTHSKIKLNLKVTKENFDKNKQARALMPNLIHSLDATSMCKLYNFFMKSYNENAQFFSIHDCFGTTADKVFLLKTILTSVYTDLYSNEQYLLKFDSDMISILKNNGYNVDLHNRIVFIPNENHVRSFTLHDID